MQAYTLVRTITVTTKRPHTDGAGHTLFKRSSRVAVASSICSARRPELRVLIFQGLQLPMRRDSPCARLAKNVSRRHRLSTIQIEERPSNEFGVVRREERNRPADVRHITVALKRNRFPDGIALFQGTTRLP